MAILSEEIIEQKKLETTDNGDHDKFAHYVPKKELELAILEGKSVKALCGKQWLPFGDFSKYEVCPTCKEKYEQMK